eukprot:PhM_4_TR15825/c0_g1_i1/m.95569
MNRHGHIGHSVHNVRSVRLNHAHLIDPKCKATVHAAWRGRRQLEGHLTARAPATRPRQRQMVVLVVAIDVLGVRLVVEAGSAAVEHLAEVGFGDAGAILPRAVQVVEVQRARHVGPQELNGTRNELFCVGQVPHQNTVATTNVLVAHVVVIAAEQRVGRDAALGLVVLKVLLQVHERVGVLFDGHVVGNALRPFDGQRQGEVADASKHVQHGLARNTGDNDVAADARPLLDVAAAPHDLGDVERVHDAVLCVLRLRDGRAVEGEEHARRRRRPQLAARARHDDDTADLEHLAHGQTELGGPAVALRRVRRRRDEQHVAVTLVLGGHPRD